MAGAAVLLQPSTGASTRFTSVAATTVVVVAALLWWRWLEALLARTPAETCTIASKGACLLDGSRNVLE
jgi:membrane protein implicated in regulation of membrane protease activity